MACHRSPLTRGELSLQSSPTPSCLGHTASRRQSSPSLHPLSRRARTHATALPCFPAANVCVDTLLSQAFAIHSTPSSTRPRARCSA
eukprot:scaffold138096_cov127-Phaeocystis_antarctica.AAC.2